MSGVTRENSISIPEERAETVRAQARPGGFPSYVTEALRHRAMDKLTEITDDHETRNGAFTDAELARADSLLGCPRVRTVKIQGMPEASPW